ncbi:YigZ family protein [Tuberibacillus calidus]|uniref:YigZ family protein n=1 Tax=Tuberibacillus calidus TaxID=340097 RepID=UPI0004179A58|nr:YigZ family protein [Tuberibacillus calidus]
MTYPYYTVKKPTMVEITIQKSRFIGHVRRISSEEEARSAIEAISKEHWKANHNCYAYVVGEDSGIQKASDNGEPAGTAGVPILEVIKKKNLRDTLIVVTRYFGGIKLGAGGLIRAYSKTASAAISASGIVERLAMKVFAIKIDYSLYGTIENALRETPYLTQNATFTDIVTIEIAVRTDEADIFTGWMTNLCNGACSITELGETFLEVDVV